jgi:hypothetical protein
MGDAGTKKAMLPSARHVIVEALTEGLVRGSVKFSQPCLVRGDRRSESPPARGWANNVRYRPHGDRTFG